MHCPSGQRAASRACGTHRIVSNATLPGYKSGMENQFFCDSGTQFILSSTGAPMPPIGWCAAGRLLPGGHLLCQPAGHDPRPSGQAGRSGGPKPGRRARTTVHTVFATPSGPGVGVGEHGIGPHAPPGGGTSPTRPFESGARVVGWHEPDQIYWAVGAGGSQCAAGRRAPGGRHHAAVGGAAVEHLGHPAASCGRWDASPTVGGDGASLGDGGSPTRAAGTGRAQGDLGQSRSDVWTVGAGFEPCATTARPGVWAAAPEGASGDLLAVGGAARRLYFVGRGGPVAHVGADGQLANAGGAGAVRFLSRSGRADRRTSTPSATTGSSCTRPATATGPCRSRARAIRCSP